MRSITHANPHPRVDNDKLIKNYKAIKPVFKQVGLQNNFTELRSCTQIKSDLFEQQESRIKTKHFHF